ncbi:hypothetical protein COCON_G00173030 [Conger conger]|uniref:C2H2-type domain-containing protein n=1 Tax=Conger conger TaxID=82655 RepID=A0A9Q1D4A1_CONCO|nr:hypothetical protein COCON_G00173030 [Conger conger]
MTKLQVLNVYFTERLMAAAQEILQVVEETLMEYQEESDRAKRENESLRRRLREAGLNEEAGRTKSPQSAPLLSADRTVPEQQEWSSREQDPDPHLTAVKLEFTEPQRNRREEEEDHRQEEELHCSPGLGTGVSALPSPFSKRECDQNSLIQPTFPSPCGKRDGNLKLHFGNAGGDEPAPSATRYQVKTESDGVSYSPSDQPAEPLPFHLGPFDAAALPSRTDMSVFRDPGGQMSELEAQLSPGTLERLRGQSTHFCPQCGKAFRHRSQSGVMKRHLQVHNSFNYS